MKEVVQSIPIWLQGIASLLTALALFIPLLMWYLNKKKSLKESHYVLSGENSSNIIELINDIKGTLEKVSIVNIVKIRNGHNRNDPHSEGGDVTKPKYGKCIYSTDFNTLQQWKNEFELPQQMVMIHGVAVSSGECEFSMDQLDDTASKVWYESNGLKQTIVIRIAVNDLKKYGLFLYINFNEKHIMSADKRIAINLFNLKLQKYFEPFGWRARKNYLTQ